MKNSPDTKQKSSVKIWQLGDHRLAQGDSSDPQLIKALLGGQKINLICTDPPYGVAVAESKRNFRTLSKDKDIAGDQLQSNDEYLKFTQNWLEAIKPHLATKNAAYIFNADKMIWPLHAGLVDSGFKFAQLLVWMKQQSVIGRLDYAPQHELILYAWYGTHAFRRSKDKSVIFYPRPHSSKLHPTMKPVGLITRLILNSTQINDTVFDGFLGSGTTLLACEQIKRRCFGVELDPEYCKTIIERWELMTKRKARRIC